MITQIDGNTFLIKAYAISVTSLCLAPIQVKLFRYFCLIIKPDGTLDNQRLCGKKKRVLLPP